MLPNVLPHTEADHVPVLADEVKAAMRKLALDLPLGVVRELDAAFAGAASDAATGSVARAASRDTASRPRKLRIAIMIGFLNSVGNKRITSAPRAASSRWTGPMRTVRACASRRSRRSTDSSCR